MTGSRPGAHLHTRFCFCTSSASVVQPWYHHENCLGLSDPLKESQGSLSVCRTFCENCWVGGPQVTPKPWACWASDSPEKQPCRGCIIAFLVCFSFSEMSFPPVWAWWCFCPPCSLFCLWSQDSGVSCGHPPRAGRFQQLFTNLAHSDWVGWWRY